MEALYPEVHLDALTRVGLTEPRNIQDKEWAVNDHFRQLPLRNLSSDWSHALRFLWFKTYAVFFVMPSNARITVQEPISVDQLRDLAALRDQKTPKSPCACHRLWTLQRVVHRFHRHGRVDAKKGRLLSASMYYVLLSALLPAPFVIGHASGNPGGVV
ncbi:MAG: hypothetical protein ACHBNF_04580 [Chromatiales bacterium]